MEPVAVLGSLVETPVDEVMFHGGDALKAITEKIQDDARVRNADRPTQNGRLFMPEGTPFGKDVPLAVMRDGYLYPVRVDDTVPLPPIRKSAPGSFMDFYTDADNPETVKDLMPIKDWPPPPDTSVRWTVPSRSIFELVKGIRKYQACANSSTGDPDPAYAADRASTAYDMGVADTFVTTHDVRARRMTTPPSTNLWYRADSDTLSDKPHGSHERGFPGVYESQYNLKTTIPRLAARVKEAPNEILRLMGNNRDDLLLVAAYIDADVEDAVTESDSSSYDADILEETTGQPWP